MSMSRVWTTALAATLLVFAAQAQAAPVLYGFSSGSAVVRLTIGATTISESAPLALGGVFATFDGDGDGELVDFEFAIVPMQTVAFDNPLGDYDSVHLHYATLMPGVGYTNLIQQNNGGGNYEITAGPVLTSTGLVVMDSTPGGLPDESFTFSGPSATPLVAMIDIAGGTALTLNGITIGAFTNADFSTIPVGVTVLVKMDLDFQGMAPVPEPSASLLIGLGCVGFAMLRGRRG